MAVVILHVSSSRQFNSTPVASGQGFLSNEQRNNTGASPILSWPGCSWFLLFPGLKSVLKGNRFSYDTDVIRNATEELKRLSQNVFQKYLQQLYGRWQKCVFCTRGQFWQKCILNISTDTTYFFRVSLVDGQSPRLWFPSSEIRRLVTLQTLLSLLSQIVDITFKNTQALWPLKVRHCKTLGFKRQVI